MSCTKIWPSWTTMFLITQLVVWGVKGTPLFSWWILAVVFVAEILADFIQLTMAKSFVDTMNDKRR